MGLSFYHPTNLKPSTIDVRNARCTGKNAAAMPTARAEIPASTTVDGST
ncbi:MAG: hypothetical protein HYW57_06800 [Ignavibacteriales bacterium]|nr:hypothetical protein [Ignavibacteriales bacterium]